MTDLQVKKNGRYEYLRCSKFCYAPLARVANIRNWIRGEWTVRNSSTRKAIVEFDTFIGYSASKSSSVPTNQIEQGSFAAYNKTNNPSEFSVTLAKSGSSTVLSNFLTSLETYNDSTDLVDIVLPFRVYRNVNITGLSHGILEGQAVNLLVVELRLKEIKQTARRYESVAMPASKVQNAGDADTVNKGRQQAKQPPSIIKGWLS